MSCDEIRYWLTALRREHGWSTNLLGRTLGFQHTASAVSRKADGREWIYQSEQIRASRQIERILSGELIPTPGKPWHAGRAVLAAEPKPLVPGTHWIYDLKARRLRLVPRERPAPLRVPCDGSHSQL
jgi:hypothetical protein